MSIVIIAEKPDAARRIAEALAENKSLKAYTDENKVTYYEFEKNGKKHIVVCAVGHLFNLAPLEKSWKYPIFNYTWKPSFEVNKESAFSKKYFDVVKKIVEKGSDFIIATDYDTEGELIGANILRFLANRNDAKRMKFSALTKDELIESYEKVLPHLDFGQLEAGLTRHELDWLWGINITRALTLALKNSAEKGFAILSSGRVQSPTLAILLDRELEIRKFKPKPFWELELHIKINGTEAVASYEKGRIWKKEEADKILQECKGKDAKVKDIKKKKYKQAPPVPFNTTDLQAEAYQQFKFSPQQTMNIAESLYQQGFISYPRSASQKLPASVNYEKILKALASLPQYKKFAEELLKKEKLVPVEGKKEDPAHPCVYATHEVPDLSKLTPQQRKIYDLIARRTLAAFGDEALRETNTVSLDVGGHTFLLVGKRTLEPGWTKIYEPYLKREEIILPELKIGQTIKVIKLEELAKETQPPARYSQGSIIKEMEARNLGTRCITGDTTVLIVNNNKLQEVKIEELFSEKNSFTHENERILSDPNCVGFCVNGKNMETFKFNLISRRELEKNEKVYEVAFKDGSKIKLTEDHPVLIYDYDKSNFVYLPVKQLSKNMKVVSSFSYYDKFGESISWESFVKKLDPKSKLYGQIDLKAWRKSRSITQKELGKILGVGQATIAGWEKKKSLPLWVWSKLDLPIPEIIYGANKKIVLKNPFPITISSPLIRILAHLIGDGSLDREKLKRENCFDFRYTNKNLNLVRLFIADVEKIFKISKKLKEMSDKRDKDKFYVKLPATVGRILGILFRGLISKDIKIDEKFYPDFIGSIFDDEGHVYKNEVKIFISNTNTYIIKNLKEYLKKLGFTPWVVEENPKYRKKNWSKSYKIFLYGRDVAKFLEVIPFFHEIKKRRMITNLTKKYRYLNQPYLLLEKKVLSSLPKNGATMKEIASITGLSLNTVTTCIKNLRKHGYIGVKVIGISQQPRKKILYFPLKECSKTFYSFLEEDVLSPTLLTKTIENIREFDYKGYVYDVLNSPTSNFILGNNIVVHNSTRSEILQTLYDRGYISGKSIQVTKLGEAVVKALKEFCPKILSEELTRKFEEEMELVYQGKKKREEVVEEAKKTLKEILEEFKANEKKIGKKLLEALMIKREEERKLGNCPNCKNGELTVLRSKISGKIFVGCSNYPKCQTGYPLPAGAIIQATGNICEKCGTPIIQVFRKGKRPFRMCLDPKCETKKGWNNKK